MEAQEKREKEARVVGCEKASALCKVVLLCRPWDRGSQTTQCGCPQGAVLGPGAQNSSLGWYFLSPLFSGTRHWTPLVQVSVLYYFAFPWLISRWNAAIRLVLESFALSSQTSKPPQPQSSCHCVCVSEPTGRFLEGGKKEKERGGRRRGW